MCGLRQEILLARKGNKGRIQPLLAPAPSSRDPFSPRLKMLFLEQYASTYFSLVLAMPGNFNLRFSFKLASNVKHCNTGKLISII